MARTWKQTIIDAVGSEPLCSINGQLSESKNSNVMKKIRQLRAAGETGPLVAVAGARNRYQSEGNEIFIFRGSVDYWLARGRINFPGFDEAETNDRQYQSGCHA